ncbi:iron chelate uptake ABC transporter family permease subunit [Vagococcus coleopterorum]|uniref:Iron chelate uptake ABC transporter family permease subunit n=1 Tax=Vagococcus coleopterorum TaxID=2714946 RepID=A0A6G8AMA3_9ENTE|nr:iron chelate uptake ABC transporter family permease subunit [Vagococcus coleopterorum]QIL46089.1 iron chelate uptake ABC transporter family permease subunit [Vagococcus coleopterorum]
MSSLKQSILLKILCLVLVVGIFSWLFLTYNTYGNWEFALQLRGKKLLAFILVGISTAFATISFQTLTQNHFLTPSILGFDSLYIVLQTGLFFFFGNQHIELMQNNFLMFAINVLLMVGVSTILFFFLISREQENLYLLLMVGMILGTFFGSLSSFMQVMLDPNEYDKLQGKLFASFANVDVSLLQIGSVITLVVVLFLWKLSPKLDVLHLGKSQAISLGINVKRLQISLLMAISLLIAISTALVGPVTFLGFIVANLTYQFIKTYRHHILFIVGSLIGILLLVVGQFFVEQVFKWNTTMSVVIEFIGGIYFVVKILKERKTT